MIVLDHGADSTDRKLCRTSCDLGYFNRLVTLFLAVRSGSASQSPAVVFDRCFRAVRRLRYAKEFGSVGSGGGLRHATTFSQSLEHVCWLA